MKKILSLVMLLGAIMFMPTKTMAMLEVDENGNPVTKEVGKDEITTMIAPDEGVSSAGNTGSGVSGNPTKDDGGNVTADPAGERDIATDPTNAADDIMYKSGDEEIYQITAMEKDALVDNSAKEASNSALPSALLYGGIGIALGSIGTCFVISRRR